MAMADPARVDTPGDLAACLDSLRRDRGLSYEAMDAAARKLLPQQKGLEPLGKSTVGEIVRGQRFPGRGKLLTFLAVCGVPPDDQQKWVAAWGRACAANLARPGAIRVRDALPRELGVHAAIQIDSVPGELPIYVPRDLDGQLRTALAAGVDGGCFVLVVGESSVGKTRSLYEAVMAVLADWWLVHPAGPAEVRALAAAPAPKTVVWLDELTSYLGGTNGLRASTIRALRQAGMVLVGTLWPDEYQIRVARRRLGRQSDDPYEADRALLDLAEVIDVADIFTAAERDRAVELASQDGRLRLALETTDAGVTQVLAAGPALVRWWELAPDPYSKAIITAAADARRLGVESSLTREMLAAAVPGYLTSEQQARADRRWLSKAVEYATTPLHGAASALHPQSDGTMGGNVGFTLADYLLQHARRTRRAICPPHTTWQALIDYVDDPDDAWRVATSADNRLRFRYKVSMLRRLLRGKYKTVGKAGPSRHSSLNGLYMMAESGKLTPVELTEGEDERYAAALALIPLLDGMGLSADEPIKALQHFKRAGVWRAEGDLAEAQAGRLLARGQVAQALDILRTSANRGDTNNGRWLADLLVEHGRIEELKDRASKGDGRAAIRWANMLVEEGRVQKAIEVLQLCVDYDDWEAIDPWAYLKEEQLIREGRLRAVQARADAGVPSADIRWVDLLADKGRAEELHSRALNGNERAAERLTELLIKRGELEEAIEILKLPTTLAGAHMRNRERAIGLRSLLLARKGHVDEAIELLRVRADAGYETSSINLVNLLAGLGRLKELAVEVEAGTYGAGRKLIDHLDSLGKIESSRIKRMRIFGLNADGSIYDPSTEHGADDLFHDLSGAAEDGLDAAD
jgi:tetratricopeptide (TPR) repeat protein